MRIRLTLPSALALLLAAAGAPAFADGTVGAAAPSFSLKDLDGHEHSLAEYASKAVVLEWINPNCPFSNCHAEERTMTTVAGKH